MNKWIHSTLFLMLLIVGFMSTFADIPSPNSNKVRRQPRPNPVNMTIQPAETAGDARLVIPRDILQQLRASLDDTDQQDAASVTSNGEHNSRTIIAGIFMSISLAFGGLCLMRSGATPGKLARTLPARFRTADRAASPDCRHLVVGRPAHWLFDLRQDQLWRASPHAPARR